MDSWGVRLTWFDCNRACQSMKKILCTQSKKGKDETTVGSFFQWTDIL